MLENILIIILITLISFIPILFWGYLFTYLDDNSFNKNRFLIWILSGSISVFPVLYLSDIIDFTWLKFLNIFSYIYNFSSFFDIFILFLWLFGLLFMLSILPFVFLNWLKKTKEQIKEYSKIFLVFLWFLWFLAVIFYLLFLFFNTFPNFNYFLDNSSISFKNIVFNSLQLVIFYYLITALLEELSKFFCFKYSKKFEITDIKQWVLYAIFIALWFSFFENILYLYSSYKKSWLSMDFVWVYFNRNIFSLMLHVLCTSVLAYFFTKAYLKLNEYFNREFIKILLIWFFVWIFLHSMFNVFLTYNITFIIFLYFIWAYFYLTSIFYSE